MLFPTLSFGLFFLATATAAALLHPWREPRKLLLLGASYWFYAQWNAGFCLLLAGSSVATWLAGLGLARTRTERGRRLVVGLAVAFHLGVLGFFKYADFLIQSVNALAHRTGLAAELPFPGALLPIGISFFTFHGISYIVDVYRNQVAVCRRLTDMLLYIAFFPQLVAGPIVRAAFFLPQLYRTEVLSFPLAPALMLIVGGLFKKVVVANGLATGLVDPVFFDPASFGTADLLLAAYGYAIQIYCDFSAYTDIAIGVAAILGYAFPPNFDQPYRAASLQEFWRRWHISLSSWLRDYLYKPLGGSRGGPVLTARNLMITMLLGGLWHGAAWKFIVWGGLHGGALVLERWLRPLLGGRLSGPVGRALRIVLVFHFVCLTWIVFRSEDLTGAVIYLQSMAELQPGLTRAAPFTLALLAVGFALQFAPRDLFQNLAERLALLPRWALAAAASALIVAVDAMGPEGVAPFIYFQF